MRGVARVDRKTKRMLPRLRPGEIAVIDHEDIDEVAARGLIEARCSVVVNARQSMTGRFHNLGPEILLAAGVPILDGCGPEILAIADGSEIEIEDDRVACAGRTVAQGRWLGERDVRLLAASARDNLRQELDAFLENTLRYAADEKQIVLEDLLIPPLRTPIAGRHALVVVRGRDFRRDLLAVTAYIRERRPVLIGVDGGADALLEIGIRPDVVIGDMDSVSDAALASTGELIVHAYPDGSAPGLERVRAAGRPAHVISSVGTSEDLAMLLCHQLGARLIVAVGTHSSMVDFLEKGRPGMASTLLTRMKVGGLLVDAKGVSQLYPTRVRPSHLFTVALAGLATIGVVLVAAPSTRQILRLVWLHVRLSIGL